MTNNSNKKTVIHIAKHKATGAEVPIIIEKMDDNGEIISYKEVPMDRKGFTLDMLQTRWDKSRDETIELLTQYQVPGHINMKSSHETFSQTGKLPVDFAFFFEEYIYAIEEKTKMPHNKLKARLVDGQQEH